MLKLSRKVGERIIIGDEITLTVIRVDRGRVCLGFSAPREIPIFREELVNDSHSQGEAEHE